MEIENKLVKADPVPIINGIEIPTPDHCNFIVSSVRSPVNLGM